MDQAIKFKALNFTEENIGKLIKSSKRKLHWAFTVNGKRCDLVFKISKISKNYSVELNGQLLHKGNKTYDTCFEFKFKIERVLFVVKEIAGTFSLYVECVAFKRLQEHANGRKTMLIAPAPLLFVDDFNEYAPGEKVRLLASSPVKKRAIDELKDEERRFFPSPAKKASRLGEFNEQFLNANKEQNDQYKGANYIGNTGDRSEDTNVKGHDHACENMIDSDITMSKESVVIKGFDLGRWMEMSFETQSEEESGCGAKSEGLKESMDIIVYPNDFESHDVSTERIIKVLYKM